MSEVTVENLEHQLSETKRMVELADRIERLTRNKDFREIIIENFCKVDSARYAHESADPALTAEQRADALALAQAGGHLKRYLSIQLRMANVARGNIAELEEAIVEARAEEGAR